MDETPNKREARDGHQRSPRTEGILIGRLFSRGVERRGDQYVVSYEDDTGSHERVFPSKREAKSFRASLGMTTGTSLAEHADSQGRSTAATGYGRGPSPAPARRD